MNFLVLYPGFFGPHAPPAPVAFDVGMPWWQGGLEAGAAPPAVFQVGQWWWQGALEAVPPPPPSFDTGRMWWQGGL